jgi:membrane protein implicated in regulation of membrane protease activity
MTRALGNEVLAIGMLFLAFAALVVIAVGALRRIVSRRSRRKRR